MRGVGVCVRAGLPCVTVCVHVRMVLARVCVAGCVEPCRVWVVFGGLCVRAVICSKVLADVERERVCVWGGGVQVTRHGPPLIRLRLWCAVFGRRSHPSSECAHARATPCGTM
jgi:hypothetical protein